MGLISRWPTTLRALLNYLQHGCLEIFHAGDHAREQSSLKWRLFKLLEHTKLRIDLLYSHAVLLKMFSLTDIQPGPTDIGEILVKVRRVDKVADFCFRLLTFGSLTSLQVNYLQLVGTFKGII